MREASVGYQCPSCVNEGRKSTRSGRTAYGGLVSHTPGVVSWTLIGINVVVWAVIEATGRYGSTVLQHFGLMPGGSCASISNPNASYPHATTQQACEQLTRGDGHWLPGVAHGAPWELITNIFTHVEILHIAFNMYALWVLGPQLEQVLGRARFIALYLVAGLAGSVCVLWFSAPDVVTVGASGAIFGLMAGLLVIGHKVGADLTTLWIWVAINAFLTFRVPDISWQGHVGGFIGGGIVAFALAYAPRERRGLVQGASIAGLVVLLGVAAVVRIGMLA